MKISTNFSLKHYNAFKLDVRAKYFVEIKYISDLQELASHTLLEKETFFILGEGFNTLFTKDYNGVVIKINILGKKILKQTNNDLILEIGAGENWIELVNYTLKKNWGGLENLSFIPGAVGAAPVQNIGAYGQSFDQVFVSLDAFDIKTGATKVFTKNECLFGYRNSFFKMNKTKRFIITKVRIKLTKNPKVNLGYKSRYESLVEELKTFANTPFTIHDVSLAVTAIRKRKFPDWKKVGTAGSFFLNPIISKTKLKQLQNVVPGVQFYMVDKFTSPSPSDRDYIKSKQVKIAAGWLLEELGWKGKKIGNIETSTNQSLVIIANKSATPTEILNFSKEMVKDFEREYKIKLEPEVNIV